jgi:hypothetical protein
MVQEPTVVSNVLGFTAVCAWVMPLDAANAKPARTGASKRCRIGFVFIGFEFWMFIDNSEQQKSLRP